MCHEGLRVQADNETLHKHSKVKNMTVIHRGQQREASERRGRSNRRTGSLTP
jgi:hypothetical protein